jgi:hypothetical protein
MKRSKPKPDQEMWRDVPNYEGKYQVSNIGRVRSLRYMRGKCNVLLKEPLILKQYSGEKTRNYMMIGLNKNNKRQSYRVHRLVLEAFCGFRPAGKEAAHLNGDPSDNRIQNLMWATQEENLNHKRIHGTIIRGSMINNAKLKESDIPVIFKLRYQGMSSRELAARFKVGWTTMKYLLAGKTWVHAHPRKQSARKEKR